MHELYLSEIATKQDIKARPSKVVAGLEADKTNELLQAIAKAIDRKIDTTEAVEIVKSGKHKQNNTTQGKEPKSNKVQVKNETQKANKQAKDPTTSNVKKVKSESNQDTTSKSKKKPETNAKPNKQNSVDSKKSKTKTSPQNRDKSKSRTENQIIKLKKEVSKSNGDVQEIVPAKPQTVEKPVSSTSVAKREFFKKITFFLLIERQKSK